MVISADSPITSWFYSELSMLCLLPCFFFTQSNYKLPSLAVYIIVGGLSSSLYLVGLVSFKYLFLVYLGFYIKFGLFPLMYWVYIVGLNSNWLVISVLTVFFKSSALYFTFALSGSVWITSLVNLGCILTFLSCSVFFWLGCPSWYHVWCHMTISSSAVLFGSVVGSPSSDIFLLYGVYLVWGSLTVGFFYWFSGLSLPLTSLQCFLYIMLIISWPLSFSFLYKVLTVGYLGAGSFWLVAFWVLYSFSEQCYLISRPLFWVRSRVTWWN